MAFLARRQATALTVAAHPMAATVPTAVAVRPMVAAAAVAAPIVVARTAARVAAAMVARRVVAVVAADPLGITPIHTLKNITDNTYLNIYRKQ